MDNHQCSIDTGIKYRRLFNSQLILTLQKSKEPQGSRLLDEQSCLLSYRCFHLKEMPNA